MRERDGVTRMILGQWKMRFSETIGARRCAEVDFSRDAIKKEIMIQKKKKYFIRILRNYILRWCTLLSLEKK